MAALHNSEKPLRLKIIAEKEKDFRIYRAADFPDLPEMKWLVEEIFPERGLLCIYGPSGVGKSFLCLSLAAAIAEGQDWFGHATKRSNVVYVALEGQAGLRLRAAAWEKHHGRPFPAGVGFIFEDFRINDLAEPKKLGVILEDQVSPGLVIIDTLNRASPGSDENACADMNGIIAGATMLQMTSEAAVLLVHHPGKDVTRRLRGHSSLFAALDTVIELDEDGDVVRWQLIKSKDSEYGQGHAFKLRPIEFGTGKSGKPLKSCVVEPVEGYVPTKRQSRPNGANQQAVLAAAREILVKERIQSFDLESATETFEGLAFDDLLNRLGDTLQNVPPSHRKDRTRTALKRLCEMGYLLADGDYITLPTNESE